MVNREEFVEILKANEGVVYLIFSASWCKPCQTIKPYLAAKLPTLPKTAKAVVLDVDLNTDLYAHLKSKKQVRGVPVMLAYKKGNLTPFADRSVSGANVPDWTKLFEFVSNEIKA